MRSVRFRYGIPPAARPATEAVKTADNKKEGIMSNQLDSRHPHGQLTLLDLALKMPDASFPRR